ncbi:hypothetical protein LOTGIDRAFT_155591 [Lottia gigantea]|uniref:G-protein coupled receptors family 2 profile 2 domain-containing protein n=1 Tax=Lottia gigantea TaxID=225164 RepID=V3ZTL1_LOTGI|nr:hypothetical protein LOTGIDRAFT_155591 [Lottia gigantea]ESO84256.1 hypothetical protein LOTGIDRAFT_155591 [Lottia gigantea]
MSWGNVFLLIPLLAILSCPDVQCYNDTQLCSGEAWSCQNTCGSSETAPCSCHPSCTNYQICCEDYEEFCVDSNEENATDHQRQGYCSSMLDVWLVEGCVNNDNHRYYDRCITPNNTILYDITPVTNLQTKVHYKNRYCALCNNDNDTTSWSVDEICTNITDFHHYFNLCISQMKNPIDQNPALCLAESISTYNKSKALENGLSEQEIQDLEDKCNSFTSYVTDGRTDNVYKNRYCYLLNGHNETHCSPTMFDKFDVYCVKHRHQLNQCMKDACAQDKGFQIKYCSKETFRLSMQIVFEKRDTRELNIIGDEEQLLMDNSQLLNDGILNAYENDVNTTISCNVQSTKSRKDGFIATFNSVLNCKIGDRVDESLFTEDILNIIPSGVKSIDDQIKLPMKVEISACIIRTTIFRRTEFTCSRTNFNISVINVVRQTSSDIEEYISTIFCALSDIGLLCRIFLQFAVPYFQTLPGKVQFCLCCTLFVAYTSFLLAGVFQIGTFPCYIAAVFTHWSFLSSLFWMNVIAFQIWHTFRVWHNQVSERCIRTLIVSSLYAMGAPTILVGSALSIEFFYPQNSFSPAYGKYSCWMNKSYSVLTWFVIPCCTLSFVNTVFALLTVRGLRVQRMIDKSPVSKIAPVNDFAVSVRIVILVGVTWLLGLFAAFLGSPVTWMIFTLFNASLGFLISLVLLCNRRIFGLLKDKCLCPVRETFNSITLNTSRQA